MAGLLENPALYYEMRLAGCLGINSISCRLFQNTMHRIINTQRVIIGIGQNMPGDLNRNEIIRRLTSEFPFINKNFGIKKIGLFGSYARDEGMPDSDIDLIVTFEDGKEKFRIFFAGIYYLEQIFGRKVEMISEHALDTRIKPYIEREVIWIYS